MAPWSWRSREGTRVKLCLCEIEHFWQRLSAEQVGAVPQYQVHKPKDHSHPSAPFQWSPGCEIVLIQETERERQRHAYNQ